MDASPEFWHFSAMTRMTDIPAFQLYGEDTAFPDMLHMEQIRDRAAGLDWVIRPHRHTHLFQVFLLLSGDVRCQIDGRSLSPALPVALALPPGCVHGFQFATPSEGWVISLPVQHYPDLFGPGADLAAALSAPLILPAPEGMDVAVRALHDVWQGRDRFRRTLLRCRLGLILSDLLRATPAPDTRAPDPRVAQFQALVAVQAAHHWPVARFAVELGLSERTLGRLCKAQTGLSPQALIEAHLMREASRMLAYTRMPAQSVAHALGYDDGSYFSRRFRTFAGLSPRAYRARLDQP